MTTFIDTSVIFSVKNSHERFSSWSEAALERADPPLVISDIVFSELSAVAASIDEVILLIDDMNLEQVRPSRQALFIAGQAFLKYKKASESSKLRKLPDLLIGAHSLAEDCPLITTNPRDIRSYFPKLQIICPDELVKLGK